MQDATQQPAAIPNVDPTQMPAGDAQTGGDPAGQKNPLDILEELLSDAQNKKAAGAGGGGLPGEKAQASADAQRQRELEQQQAAEEERQRQEMIAQQQIADQQALVQKQAELKTIKDMPQYQARVQQEQEKAEQAEEDKSNQSGFEINQLDHTKI